VAHLRWAAVPLDHQRHVRPVEESGQLVQKRQQCNIRRAPPHTRHRAPRSGHGGVANVDVSAELGLKQELGGIKNGFFRIALTLVSVTWPKMVTSWLKMVI